MSSDEVLDAAEEALDDGRALDALEILAALPDADPGRALLAVHAHLDLARDDPGGLARAREELAWAAGGLDPDDPALRAARAELRLREWRIEDARALFAELVAEDPSPAALDRLALCAELCGDDPAADAHRARAATLDPQGWPLPPRLDDEEFDAVVEAAIAELPPAHRAALERARVVAEPLPFRELIQPDDPGATPPDLLGLFVGDTLHELAEDTPGRLPPQIYLFQRNLERHCLDRDELREQIRITLYHELGHLLGLDEDEVDALGLG